MRKFLLSCLLLIACLATATQLSAQNTCLADWQYTRAISARNAGFGLLNDWQIRVVLNTQALIAAGKMNADGSDIRFTSNDCCTELPYWIQGGLNTPATTIWTRMPQLVSNDTTWLQIHYGNPAANTPISNIDLVHFSVGNDSMGTAPAQAGITAATQELTFPFNCRTVRFRLYSGDTMRLKFKVTNDTNMVTGTSPFFTAPSGAGFRNFDAEMISSAGGHPGWFSSTGGNFMNFCSPITPCPGSCGDIVYKPLDQVVFGALKTDTCGVIPSMKVWYRRSVFPDVTTNTTWPEFDRMQPFAITAPNGTDMCFNDTLRLEVNDVNAVSYQWYRNGGLVPGANDTVYLAPVDGTYHCVADFGLDCQSFGSDSVTLTYRSPLVNLGADVEVCSDTGYTIVAALGYQAYLWNDNSTQNTLTVSNSGTYSIMVTDSFGCIDHDTIQITLRPIPVPVINIVGPSSVCRGGLVALDALNPSWYAYRWLPGGETSGNIDVGTAGSYSVIVWDQYFCSDTSASVTVSIFPDPVLELGPPTGVCEGSSALLDAGTGWTSIVWPDSSTNQTFMVSTTGYFVASVTDTNGCTDTDTAIVQIYNNPTVDIGPSDTLCAGTTMLLDAGPGMASYAWTNGALTQTINAGPGVYNVSFVDANGCSGTSNVVYLTAYTSLTVPTVILAGTSLYCSPSPNFQWYLDGTMIPGANTSSYTPTVSGTYSVGVTDIYGCQDVTSNLYNFVIEQVVTINAEDIPQGFSPNGDGINDRFVIANIAEFPGSSLVIRNRWGAEVYVKKPYDNSFGGQGNGGKDLPDGTYFYILDLGNGTVYQEYLIINR